MLMSGFSAFAAEPPAPPRLTGAAATFSSAGAEASAGAPAGACAGAAAAAGAGAPCAFSVRTCPSRAIRRSSKSRIFCWSAALSSAGDVPLPCCANAMPETTSANKSKSLNRFIKAPVEGILAGMAIAVPERKALEGRRSAHIQPQATPERLHLYRNEQSMGTSRNQREEDKQHRDQYRLRQCTSRAHRRGDCNHGPHTRPGRLARRANMGCLDRKYKTDHD